MLFCVVDALPDLWICFLRDIAAYELGCAEFLIETRLDEADGEVRRAHSRNLEVLAGWIDMHRGEIPDMPRMNRAYTKGVIKR